MAKKKVTKRAVKSKKDLDNNANPTEELTGFEQYMENHKKAPKGFGDTVAKVTKATGIDKAVKFIAGEDCGCDERKEALNELFKYEKPDCLEEEEFNFIRDWKALNKSNVTYDEKKKFFEISNRIFSRKQNVNSSCAACIRKIVDDVCLVYDKYL